MYGYPYGAISNEAACKIARQRKRMGKKKYNRSGFHVTDVNTQITKFCTMDTAEKKLAQEQAAMLEVPAFPDLPLVDVEGTVIGAGSGTGEEEEGGMGLLLPIIGLIALAGIGGTAVWYFTKDN